MIACVPIVSAEVLNVVVPPLNVSVPNVALPFLNVTVPVGVSPEADVTFAVKVTLWPKLEGLPLVPNVVVVWYFPTVCASVADVARAVANASTIHRARSSSKA